MGERAGLSSVWPLLWFFACPRLCALGRQKKSSGTVFPNVQKAEDGQFLPVSTSGNATEFGKFSCPIDHTHNAASPIALESFPTFRGGGTGGAAAEGEIKWCYTNRPHHQLEL